MKPEKVRITDCNIETAEAIMRVIKESCGSPDDAFIALLLVHSRLWDEFGAGSPTTMFEYYIKDFFSLLKSYDESEALHQRLQ